MDQQRPHPHLRSVTPDVEIIDAPPPIMQEEVPAAPQRPAPVIGLGNMPEPVAAGVTPELTSHLLAIGGTAITGAGVGYLASRSLEGAGIGAGAQLTLLGFAGAVFGAGRIPTWMRIAYGVVGLSGAVGAGYLFWTRR